MTTYAGTEGTVKIGANAVAEVRNWTATFSAELADVSTLGTAYEKTRPTLKRGSGKIECFADPDNPQQNMLSAGAAVTLILVMATGKQITVPATVESVEYDQGGPAGVVTRNINWRLNGAPTF